MEMSDRMKQIVDELSALLHDFVIKGTYYGQRVRSPLSVDITFGLLGKDEQCSLSITRSYYTEVIDGNHYTLNVCMDYDTYEANGLSFSSWTGNGPDTNEAIHISTDYLVKFCKLLDEYKTESEAVDMPDLIE